MDDVKPEATPIKFEATDYWRLRTIIAEAQLAEEKAAQQIALAANVRTSLLKEFSSKYGYDVAAIKHLQWNDETCEFSFNTEPK